MMFDRNSGEWVSVETYMEMILTSDNELLSKVFYRGIGYTVSFMKAYPHGLCQILSRDFKFHGKIPFRSGVMTL